MADSIILNKTASIERCLQRVLEDYAGRGTDFDTDFTRQDAILLNLQRACEQAIDLCNHLVKKMQLGVPQSSKQPFELLEKKGVISPDLSQRLKNMVGFRNIAVHEYSKLSLEIVKSIIEHRLDDFRELVRVALAYV